MDKDALIFLSSIERCRMFYYNDLIMSQCNLDNRIFTLYTKSGFVSLIIHRLCDYYGLKRERSTIERTLYGCVCCGHVPYIGDCPALKIIKTGPLINYDLRLLYPRDKRKWKPTQKWFIKSPLVIRNSIIACLWVCKIYKLPKDIRHIICKYAF